MNKYRVYWKTRPSDKDWQLAHSAVSRQSCDEEYKKLLKKHRRGGVVKLTAPNGEVLLQHTGGKAAQVVEQKTLF